MAIGLFSLGAACGAPSTPSRAPAGRPVFVIHGGQADPNGNDSQPTSPVTVTEPASVPPPVPVPPVSGDPADPLGDRLRLNQIQVRGTHNSYHLRPIGNPYIWWQYDMPPLAGQFDDDGIRAIELDVHAANGAFEVHHIDGEDPRSTCPLFTDCLGQIVAWSAAHPSHLPIVIFLELKSAWRLADILAMESLARAAVPAAMLFKPDDLTAGRYDTVLDAIRNEGWPTLGQMRGKILFSLMAYQPLPYYYTYEGQNLHGRAFFISATNPESPHAVILTLDSSLDQEQQIHDAVQQGFLVRTRADDYPGKTSDPDASFRAALRSGAHLVMTDYPTSSTFYVGYSSVIPGGAPARCNPVSAPADCASPAETPPM
jgi:hypothetical protein